MPAALVLRWWWWGGGGGGGGVVLIGRARSFSPRSLWLNDIPLSLCLFIRVDEDRLRESSPVLARLFLQSIFISVDIRIREGHLFCDCLCDSGPPYTGQVNRKKFSEVSGLIDRYFSRHCDSINWSVLYAIIYTSNTKDRGGPPFETPRKELKNDA